LEEVLEVLDHLHHLRSALVPEVPNNYFGSTPYEVQSDVAIHDGTPQGIKMLQKSIEIIKTLFTPESETLNATIGVLMQRTRESTWEAPITNILNITDSYGVLCNLMMHYGIISERNIYVIMF
jgi:hypothetical protein